MKGGPYIIYTSLLTISVISSCALFLLVVSEALLVEADVNTTSNLNGLQNVTKKIDVLIQSNIQTDFQPGDQHYDGETSEIPKNPVLQDNEMTFAETLSLNSVTTDGLPDTGQPPILITLADNAKLDLRNADELLFINDSEKHNNTKTFVLVESKDVLEAEKKNSVSDQLDAEQVVEATLIVKAKPMHEARLEEAALATPPTTTVSDMESVVESQEIAVEQQNDSSADEVPAKAETPQEDIPSFSEWAQKQLAEAEKKDTVLNHSSQPSHSNTNVSNKSTKLRSKNYASPACGAKIVAVNPEAGSASSILSPNRDEYMLNTCNSRIWFVIELCEPLQAQKIEIANFELFSSTPKDFTVSFSDRFPTREWASVGQFTAKDMRDVQSFDLYPHLFGKFIKVEILSHHGSEHYCPISLFKVYGTSEFEVLEKENAQHVTHIDDDDEEIIDVPDVPAVEAEASKNLFGSARDAVMSIMKKAAQVLVKTEVPKNVSSHHNDTLTNNMYKKCCSPSHIIVCDNCSQALYNEVYDLISCSSDKLTSLIRQVFLRDTLKCTGICQPFGLDFKSTKTLSFTNERVAYMKAIFSNKYLAALCNILAIKEKKVVLNTSFEAEQNVTTNITLDKTVDVNTENQIDQSIKLPLKNDTYEDNNKTEATTESDDNKDVIQERNNDSVTNINENELPKEDKAPTEDVMKSEPATVLDDEPVQEQIDTEIINKTTKESPETKEEEQLKTDQENKEASKNDVKTNKINATGGEKLQNMGGVEDVNEPNLFIDNDSFLSDLDQLTVDPTPSGAQTTQNSPNQGQTIQKESVFLRLSNRVKTLERNMSLSGQYLEELSRRYKKQVEEMQKTFEKTILQMTEERRKSNEREQKYLEQMTSLQDQLSQMASAMNILMEDRESWFGNITFFKFIVLQSFILAAALYYVAKRPRPEPMPVPVRKKSLRNKKSHDKMRRKSVEGVSGHETPSAKKRRPSEEALQIARKCTEDMEMDDDDGEWQVARRHRKRKTSILHRNLESDKMNWARQDTIGRPQENPIPLDEEEFLAPVSEPTHFVSKEVTKTQPKPNGSIFTNLKNKTIKTRRLSSPAFLRTLSRQSSRSTPSPVVRSLEPVYNGKVSKKSASESPTGSLWSEATDASHINGHDSDNVSAKQKKKSFKNIFKKVF